MVPSAVIAASLWRAEGRARKLITAELRIRPGLSTLIDSSECDEPGASARATSETEIPVSVMLARSACSRRRRASSSPRTNKIVLPLRIASIVIRASPEIERITASNLSMSMAERSSGSISSLINRQFLPPPLPDSAFGGAATVSSSIRSIKCRSFGRAWWRAPKKSRSSKPWRLTSSMSAMATSEMEAGVEGNEERSMGSLLSTSCANWFNSAMVKCWQRNVSRAFFPDTAISGPSSFALRETQARIQTVRINTRITPDNMVPPPDSGDALAGRSERRTGGRRGRSSR